MKSFIRSLYYGNIRPSEKNFDRNSKYETIMNVLVKNEDVLSEALSGKEKNLFSEYVKAWGDLLSLDARETFVSGFRLGANFALDTFVNADNQFKSITSEED